MLTRRSEVALGESHRDAGEERNVKAFANTAMVLGAIVLMGWLMLAQSAYQRGFGPDLTPQTGTSNQVNLAASMDRAMLALR
jgi:hypothetical protein